MLCKCSHRFEYVFHWPQIQSLWHTERGAICLFLSLKIITTQQQQQKEIITTFILMTWLDIGPDSWEGLSCLAGTFSLVYLSSWTGYQAIKPTLISWLEQDVLKTVERGILQGEQL